MTRQTKGDGKPFSEVLREESNRLARAAPAAQPRADAASEKFQARRTPDAQAGPPRRPGPIGLALSGGGIRSATFSLGVLQALAFRKLLNRFDYLSTVSGGGYVGTWLSAWIHRTRTSLQAQVPKPPPGGAIPAPPPGNFAPQALAHVESALGRSAHNSSIEPPEVQWLRRYSNYLTPRIGMLSADALTIVAIWLRNLFLNALILIALTAAVLLLPVLAVPAAEWMIAPVSSFPLFHWVSSNTWVPMLIGLIGGAVSIGRVSTHLTLSSPKAVAKFKERLQPNKVLKRIILPAFVAAIFGSIWLIGNDFSKPGLSVQLVDFIFAKYCPACAPVLTWKIASPVIYGVVAFLFFAVAASLYWWRALYLSKKECGANPVLAGDKSTYLLALIATFAITVLLLAYWTSLWNLHAKGTQTVEALAQASVVVPMLTLGPPLMMIVFGIVGSLWVGFVGRSYQEPSREWWARMNGWHIAIGLAWLVVFLLAFYVPPALAWVHHESHAWLTAIAGTTWLGSLVGAYLGKNLSTNSETPSGRWTGMALNVATAIVAVGIFVALAGVQGYVLGAVVGAPPLEGDTLAVYVDQFLRRIDTVVGNGNWLAVLLAELLLVAAAVGLALRVDINKFSLHNMYKNRLTRCYLGATNADRRPQPFTGFDPADDLPLKDLDDQRPFQIFNTAMNLTQGKELAWQQRKAAAFVLTPAYCGFELSDQQGDQGVRGVNWHAYKPTDKYATEDPGRENQGFSLGMAMATSGAAASPNMGFLSTPALAVIMTFFNVRLGRWSPNPIGKTWKKASPACGLMYLLAELAGSTNEERDFVYLSDGGHFENTAVYELIRRECAVILMVDAGADPDRAFADLANLKRKVRVDFGYEITLPLDRLRRDPAGGLSTAGFEIGEIHYRPAGSVGKIILIKPSMCSGRTESADLQNYLAEHRDFPQQSTANQWFDESQFESYRKLGFELGLECVDQHAALLAPAPAPAAVP